jgi:hypothetical protein
MIEVKQAVETAANYLADLFAKENISDIRLEEVELSDDGKTWYITLSFLRKAKATGQPVMDALSSGQYGVGPQNRDLKILAVRATDGVVTSVKIRQLA